MNADTLNPASPAPDADSFLDRFFAAPNQLTLAKINEAEGPAAESIRAWIADLRHSRGIVLLPCLRRDRREWYGLAFNDRQYRALTELITAFVGPTYSTYRGGAGPLVNEDPTDLAALEFTNGHALKFEVPAEDAQTAAARIALDRMRSLIRKRPAFGTETPVATGRLLRDYYMSLRAGDRESADAKLRRLETGFRLDPVNLLYLRVQAHAEFGEWSDLLALSELNDLLSLRRPTAVTQALLVAVYRAQLAEFEARDEPSAAIGRFKTVIYPKYAALFTSYSGLTARDAQMIFMLFAVSGPSPSSELRDQILADIDPQADRAAFIQRVGAILPRTAASAATAGDVMVRAEREAHHGRYDEAFRLAVELPNSVDRARVLLDVADGLRSIECTSAALEAFSVLSAQERDGVLSDRRRADAYEALIAQTPGGGGADEEGSLPSDWFAWIAAVKKSPNWSQAVQLARRGATEWTFDHFLADTRPPSEFARSLSEACGVPAVQYALPHLLEFFQADPSWPRREFAPVYSAMIELLVFTSGIADEDLGVFHQLVQAVLSLGEGKKSYEGLVGNALDLLKDYSAPSRIDWSLDMLDLFLMAECPEPDIRLTFAAAVAALLQKFRRRASQTQLRFFGALCEELGHPEIVPSTAMLPDAEANDVPEGVDPISRLGKRSIGVYTLTESAGRRFADVLVRLCPTAIVEANHDLVATDRLKSLSRNADIFLMGTASATHAATLFIQQQRPPGQPLLRPAGKGTASMLRTIREYATALD